MKYEVEKTGNAGQPRFSKLAGTAIFLAPLLLLGSSVLSLYWLYGTWQSGWAGFGQLIAFVIWVQIVLIGGSVAAVATIALALVARRKIHRSDKLRGLPQVRLAIIVSLASLLGIWGALGSVAAIRSHREAPRRAAEADVRAAYVALADHAREHKTFPDKLEDVISPEAARRYTYLGMGLPSEYIDHQTPGSQSIVVMYSIETIDGEHTAVCANGMTYGWTPLVLHMALKDSEKVRNGE